MVTANLGLIAIIAVAGIFLTRELGQLGKGFTDALGGLEGFGDNLNQFGSDVQDQFGNLRDYLTGGADEIGMNIQTGLDDAGMALDELGMNIQTGLEDAGSNIEQGLNDADEFLRGEFEDFSRDASNAFDTAGEFGSDIQNDFNNLLQNAQNDFNSFTGESGADALRFLQEQYLNLNNFIGGLNPAEIPETQGPVIPENQGPVDGRVNPDVPLTLEELANQDRFAMDQMMNGRDLVNVQSQIDGQQFRGTAVGSVVRETEQTAIELRTQIIEDRDFPEQAEARRLADIQLMIDLRGLEQQRERELELDADLQRRADEANMMNQGEFFGLSPEQIALRITGGDISNF